MSNLVARLRGLYPIEPSNIIAVCDEAADEIERLNDLVAMQKRDMKNAMDEIQRLRAERDNWIDTAAQNQRNTDFYRGIVVAIGEPFGLAAKTSDDGSVQKDVLALKVPELVCEHIAELESKLNQSLQAEQGAVQRNAELESALREISKGEGRYDTDPLKHCGNTVEDMIGLAKKALKEGL